MKRTNVVVDETLVAEGLRATGLQTFKDLVDHAIREVVRRKRQLRILDLYGKVNWEGDLDNLRSTR
jgi:Arc/MetJ family transcription regulator